MPTKKSKKPKAGRNIECADGSEVYTKESGDRGSVLCWIEKEVIVSGTLIKSAMLEHNHQKRKSALLDDVSVYLMGETRNAGKVWIASKEIHDLPKGIRVNFKAKVTDHALTEYDNPVKGVGFYQLKDLKVKGMLTKDGDKTWEDDYTPWFREDIKDKSKDYTMIITRFWRKKLQEILPPGDDLEAHMKNPLILEHIARTARWFETD